MEPQVNKLLHLIEDQRIMVFLLGQVKKKKKKKKKKRKRKKERKKERKKKKEKKKRKRNVYQNNKIILSYFRWNGFHGFHGGRSSKRITTRTKEIL